MRLSGLLYFYGRRLRYRPVQELLAGVGIAIGVALVLAVQVANSSITDASSEIVRGIAGTATLQLRSRDANGFDERILRRVHKLPGVVHAAPILEQSATLVGRHGRSVAIDLASAAPGLTALNGSIARSISVHELTSRGVLLPIATAAALDLSPQPSQEGEQVSLQVRGHTQTVPVLGVLGPEVAGALSDSMAAISPLWFVQKITGLSSRATRILIKTKPGQEALVEKELRGLAAGRMAVGPTDEEVGFLKQAVTPNTEATGFFALVSAIVGLLLAFNAMLLTVPERRRMIADLRMQGIKPRELAKMLLFQALCLGVMASLVGLLVGDLLSRTIFHETPSYLATAFPLGTQTVIEPQALAIAFMGGILATCIAAAPPLLDLRRSRAVDAVYFEEGEPGQALSNHARLHLFLGGVVVLLATNGLLLFWPSGIAVATVGLALGTLLAVPLGFRIALGLAEYVGSMTPRLNMLTVAVRTLRATTVRSLALAATGAIAVFGCVVAEDSHYDLLHGLDRAYSEYVSSADIWIVNSNDDLATIGFRANKLVTRVAATPGVGAVRSSQGGFLDVDGRRLWIIARVSSMPSMVPVGQMEQGSASQATARLREGGWITVSRQIAEASHVSIGQILTLPTPSGPRGFRVAATTTNLGWSSGAIIINSTDYQKAWRTSDVTALEVDVRPGYGVQAVKQQVQALLGAGVALRVQTSEERAAQADALARQGLSRMSQISLLLMIAAALAMAAAMGAGIWQRRSTLAALRIQSFSPSQLRRILACESVLVLLTGAVAGSVAGTYGHLLSDRFLRLTTGFPAPFALGGVHTVQTVLLIVIAAIVALAFPGYAASRVPPQVALQR